MPVVILGLLSVLLLATNTLASPINVQSSVQVSQLTVTRSHPVMTTPSLPKRTAEAVMPKKTTTRKYVPYSHPYHPLLPAEPCTGPKCRFLEKRDSVPVVESTSRYATPTSEPCHCATLRHAVSHGKRDARCPCAGIPAVRGIPAVPAQPTKRPITHGKRTTRPVLERPWDPDWQKSNGQSVAVPASTVFATCAVQIHDGQVQFGKTSSSTPLSKPQKQASSEVIKLVESQVFAEPAAIPDDYQKYDTGTNNVPVRVLPDGQILAGLATQPDNSYQKHDTNIAPVRVLMDGQVQAPAYPLASAYAGAVSPLPGSQIQARHHGKRDMDSVKSKLRFVNQILHKRGMPRTNNVSPQSSKMADKSQLMPSSDNTPHKPGKDVMPDAFTGRRRRESKSSEPQGKENAQKRRPSNATALPLRSATNNASNGREKRRAPPANSTNGKKGAFPLVAGGCKACGRPMGYRGCAETLDRGKRNVAGMNGKGGRKW